MSCSVPGAFSKLDRRPISELSSPASRLCTDDSQLWRICLLHGAQSPVVVGFTVWSISDNTVLNILDRYSLATKLRMDALRNVVDVWAIEQCELGRVRRI